MVPLGAGVIIYLAPEIGPADTAGRFNGRTMLELTKTKTKHQLGDFFFHFAYLFVSQPRGRGAAIFLPPRRVKEEDRRCILSYTRPTYVYTPWIESFSTPLPPHLHPSPVPQRFASFTPLDSSSSIVAAVSFLLSSERALAPPPLAFKPYAPFGAQVAALSQIMANKLPDEIARSWTTAAEQSRRIARSTTGTTIATLGPLFFLQGFLVGRWCCEDAGPRRSRVWLLCRG